MGSVDDFASYPRPAQAQQGREDTRGVVSSRKAAPKRVRRASLALALSRLEREHVALLLAICELETPNPDDPQAEVLRAALLPMLREDLRQTQQALGRAASTGRARSATSQSRRGSLSWSPRRHGAPPARDAIAERIGRA